MNNTDKVIEKFNELSKGSGYELNHVQLRWLKTALNSLYQGEVSAEEMDANEWLKVFNREIYDALDIEERATICMLINQYTKTRDKFPTASIESEQGKEYKDKCSGCGYDDWSSIGLVCDNGLHEFSVCRICGMTIFPDEMYVNNSPDQSKSTNK